MTERIDLLSIILDALSCFESTISSGDRDWPSYPSTGDPDTTLVQYMADIRQASIIVSALMPGPRLTAEQRTEARRFVNDMIATYTEPLDPT